MINSPESSLYQLVPSKWPMPTHQSWLPTWICVYLYLGKRGSQGRSILRMAGLYHLVLQLPLSKSSLSKHHSVCFCLFRKTSDIKAGFSDSLTRSGPTFRRSSLYRMRADRDEIVMVPIAEEGHRLSTGSVCPELLSCGFRDLTAFFWTS